MNLGKLHVDNGISFNHISTQAGTVAISASQKLINEGIEQGIEKGIRAMLRLGMDAAMIAAALEMPQSTVTQLIVKIDRMQ